MTMGWMIALLVIFAVVAIALGTVWVWTGHRRSGDIAIAFMLALAAWLLLTTILLFATGDIKGGL